MGKDAICMEEFLQDKERFADLFNGSLFLGKRVILPEELLSASEKYAEQREKESPLQKKRRERDVKMYLSCGTQLRILAVEAQKYVDYSMPVRCMNYDAQEYMKQLRELQQKNSRLILEKKVMPTTAERLCRVMKTDRLHPVYTMCLYYGREPWDGPRDLWHMMSFEAAGREREDSLLFRDYPMWLVCVNEQTDLSHYHTDIREVFQILNCRGNKQGILDLLQDKAYGNLTEETWETIATLTDWPELLKKKKRYQKTEEEGEGYDMDSAWKEILADERARGREEGREEGREAGREEGRKKEKTSIIQNMINRNFTDKDIRAAVKCRQKTIDEIREKNACKMAE